jgi:hypothetical protein
MADEAITRASSRIADVGDKLVTNLDPEGAVLSVIEPSRAHGPYNTAMRYISRRKPWGITLASDVDE